MLEQFSNVLFVIVFLPSYTDNNGVVYEYPAWAQVVGWVFEILPTAITVLFFVYSLAR